MNSTDLLNNDICLCSPGNTFGSFSRFTEDEQKWIFIGGGISALVLLAIIQAFCMLCCRNNSSRQQEEDYIDEKVCLYFLVYKQILTDPLIGQCG